MRTCGCGERGRHIKECTSKLIEPKHTKRSLRTLYHETYGKPPRLTWHRSKSRQATIERKIKSLVRRYKSFYLTIANEDEIWYIDGGNWTYQVHPNKKYSLIGHIKNLVPFLDGSRPIAWGSWNNPPEEVKPKRRRRRL